MEFPTSSVSNTLRVVYEIVKRAPSNCPSKAAAVGASVLMVVASAVMARLAVTNVDDVANLPSADVCRECSIRNRCKFSQAK